MTNPGGGPPFSVTRTYDADRDLLTSIARILDDDTEQNIYFEYNSLGNVTKTTDPLGRETIYVYDTNGIDLLSVEQKNGGSYEVLTETTYNSAHQPLTVTDAAGETTTYTYNSAGQVRTVTNALSEVTTFWYHEDGQPEPEEELSSTAIGYLVMIDGPLSGDDDSTTFAYDDFGRVRTVTDSAGYSVTTDYDAFDRPTKVTYPDETYEQILYNRLDAEWTRDRLGRWTYTLHDKLQRGHRTGSGFVVCSYENQSSYPKYTYNAITTTPTVGAGMLVSIDGPWTDDTISYTYDELAVVRGQAL